MAKRLDSELERVHLYTHHHRPQVLASRRCGCFFCLAVFVPSDITAWTDREKGAGQTAKCPQCGIDSVLPDTPEIQLSLNLLDQMERYWFAMLTDSARTTARRESRASGVAV